MGTYNPAAPQDLGFEWVAIRDEDLQFSPVVNALEQGYGFTLATSKQIGEARFYVADLPSATVNQQPWSTAIYPVGYEHLSGPIQRVIIPCNSGGVTGAVIDGGGTVAQAVADPSDNRSISFLTSGDELQLFFAMNAYANQLTGKRILGVNLLHRVTGIEDPLDDFLRAYISRSPNNSSTVYFGVLDGVERQDAENFVQVPDPARISRKAFGEINHHWTSTAPNNTAERQPWIYTQLQRFEASASGRLRVYITAGSTSAGNVISLQYAALEILYCEEQRVAVGMRLFGEDAVFASASTPYVQDVNIIPLRPLTQTGSPTLAAGSYSTVISAPNAGDFVEDGLRFAAAQIPLPTLNALRELYSIAPHPGIQVNLPFPVTDGIVGRTFTSETSHVLPMISLHATGGTVLTEIHPYGRQIAAPVYGGVVATQGIINAAYGSALPTNYPQVRFWARRFGDTAVALNIHNQSGFPYISASITPTEFDALPEILDGWKEVNLTFTGPTPSFTGAGSPTVTTYEWSASGENAGNRWEILGATSLAISGVPGNMLQTVPSGQVLDSATYGGAAAYTAWLQPNSGATASDTTSDISVIFAQDMPTVSGLGISLTSQTVSGIGLNCGLPPSCIPTGIGFNTVSWVSLATQYGASSAPISGFGYYELQRMDTIDTDWQTIMQATDVARTSFYDYEPRVGIQSSYRIRACDAYEFCGPWSSTVNATLTSPGVYGVDGNGVLIFTSNERQDGSINLAYTEQWNSSAPETQFDFPEAGSVKLQEWYNRDFVTAFRPLERGGERFEATLLVQAAAVSPPVVEDVFRSLRDMAWDTVQYICVRNELGDRWWATVIVPDGRVRRNRRLQLARVQIIEVSDTPCVAEPDA